MNLVQLARYNHQTHFRFYDIYSQYSLVGHGLVKLVNGMKPDLLKLSGIIDHNRTLLIRELILVFALKNNEKQGNN
jgi:hypothetical protein